jgi:hypothetical protein
VTSIAVVLAFYVMTRVLLPRSRALFPRVSLVFGIITLTTSILWFMLTWMTLINAYVEVNGDSIASELFPYQDKCAKEYFSWIDFDLLDLFWRRLNVMTSISMSLLAPLGYFYEEALDDVSLKSMISRVSEALISWFFFAISSYGCSAVFQSLWDNSSPPWTQQLSTIMTQNIPGLLMIAVFCNSGAGHCMNWLLKQVKPVIFSRKPFAEQLLCTELELMSSRKVKDRKSSLEQLLYDRLQDGVNRTAKPPNQVHQLTIRKHELKKFVDSRKFYLVVFSVTSNTISILGFFIVALLFVGLCIRIFVQLLNILSSFFLLPIELRRVLEFRSNLGKHFARPSENPKSQFGGILLLKRLAWALIFIAETTIEMVFIPNPFVDSLLFM